MATAPYDPVGDAQALARLVEWCGRYTPWAAADGSGCDWGGAAGILLDVTGCTHFFAEAGGGAARSAKDRGEESGGADASGEAALLADLVARLARLGFSARVALAETPGAAWALARFAERSVTGRLVVTTGRG